MDLHDLTRIVTSFADRPADLQIEKGQLLTEIRGEVIAAEIKKRGELLYVKEKDIEEEATAWIKKRLACLPLLADRILDYIPEDKYFVDPCGLYLGRPDVSDEEIDVNSSIDKLTEILPTDIPGISNIVYLTSDAGEGKTTLISQLARIQAQRFKGKEADWLLVPIPLGGRPFLRFDDVVIASLMNNLRFRFFYYDSFIELVKLGLIIPAFDGFEEMFMQNSAGEALTATGELLNRLDSSGSILIAARKAYFDYKSFSSQAKLYDSIRGTVSFTKLGIKRWEQEQFEKYANKRGVKDPRGLYDIVSSGLSNAHHAILTRPVLAKQLLDVFTENNDIQGLIKQLGSATDYFPLFVHAIIEREANTKWIDLSGEPYKPILSANDHYELLSFLAEEMWLNSTDSLRDNVLDILSELYCDQRKFNAQVSRQIKERIRQHALLVRVNPDLPIYQFDHEEFFFFFLGILIADKISAKALQEVKNLLRKGTLSDEAVSSIVHRLKKEVIDIRQLIEFLEQCMVGESQYSYIKENISNIVIKLLNGYQNDYVIDLRGYMFPMNSLLNINIRNINFDKCYVQATSLYGSHLVKCSFASCQFDRLEIYPSTIFEDITIKNCDIAIVYDGARDKGYYDIHSTNQYLASKGVISLEEVTDNTPVVEDEDLELTEKALRRFVRSNNPLNDNIFLMRLGTKGDYFFKKIVKDLLERGILLELPYVGQGVKRRFKLGVLFSDIDKALSQSKGSYQNFLNYFNKQ